MNLGPKHHPILREDALPDVVFGEAIHPGRPMTYDEYRAQWEREWRAAIWKVEVRLGASLYDEWPWWRKAWYLAFGRSRA